MESKTILCTCITALVTPQKHAALFGGLILEKQMKTGTLALTQSLYLQEIIKVAS